MAKIIRGKNNNDKAIAGCAALAFHKALIGICELSSIESVEHTALRMSKAIVTYYIAFHLMTCCMLLDEKDNYDIIMRVDKDKVKYGATLEELNASGESAEVWDQCKKYEQDLATNFNHSEIRIYCKKLRDNASNKSDWPKFKQSIYETFVDERIKENKCQPCLYEKLNYVRDRVIYRPSDVPSDSEIGFAQTSKDVRVEIESLPDSDRLYKAAQDFFSAAIESEHKEGLMNEFLYRLLNTAVSIDESDFVYEDFTKEDFDMFNAMHPFGKTFPSYIAQLAELKDRDDVVKYYKKYWKPLYNCAKEKGYTRLKEVCLSISKLD
ncbi:MAG: hypothetical protein LBM18_01005 [Oscillospiraceae bacterium]|jgi:hypothetical protein|nr:hypothetical protein [Oscillospiraceae bacterium]